MTQEKVYEHTVIIFQTEIIKDDKKAVQEVNKREVDNSLGISNPRYFEQARTPKKTKLELWAKYGDFMCLRQFS